MPSKDKTARAKRKAMNLGSFDSPLQQQLSLLGHPHGDPSELASPISCLDINTPKTHRKRGRPLNEPEFSLTPSMDSKSEKISPSFAPEELSDFGTPFLKRKKRSSTLLSNPDYEAIVFATEKNPNCQIWGRAGLSLYQNDFEKTGPRQIEKNWNDLSEWLNDSFICSFLYYFATIAKRKTVVVDPLLTDLTQMPVLRTSVIKNSFNFDRNTATEIILMPLFFPGHWTLLIHDIECGTFFADSLQITEINTESLQRIKEFIFGLCESNPDEVAIKKITASELTLQSDSCSCGFFVCLYAEAWIMNNRSLILPNLDINLGKRRILWHINSLYSQDNIQYHPRSDHTSNRRGRPRKNARKSGRISYPEESVYYCDTPTTTKQKKLQNSYSPLCQKKFVDALALSDNENMSYDNTIPIQQMDLPDLNSDSIHIPYGPIISPFGRIATDEVAQSRNLISHMWSNPNEIFSEDLIYTYLRFLASIIKEKKVIVLSPQYTNMDIHYGPFNFEFNARDNCFNYSEDYDILLVTIFFPGHFALIIFDRSDRTNLKCLFIDPLPDIDRLNNESFAHYDPKKIDLIKNLICNLTPGLNKIEFEISILSSFEFTRQNDGINCGFFVCLYAESYLIDGFLLLQDLNINQERRRILWHIAQLLNNNYIKYFSRQISKNKTKTVLSEYPTETIIEGDCPRDETGSFVCVEPEINLEPAVFLLPRSHSQSLSSTDSEKPRSRRSTRIQNKNFNPSIVVDNAKKTKQNVLTRRCYKKHEGLPCADVRSKHTTEYYDSGNIGDILCYDCEAELLKSEAVKKHGKFSSYLCCGFGKVKLPPFKTYPSPLKQYLQADTPDALEFLSLQNVYNSLVAFASISVGYQETSLDGNICYLLNGEFVHQIGSILPGKFAPSFSQLYILDPIAALEQRTKNVAYGGDRVNPETLKKLDAMLRALHPLAKELLNFHTQYKNMLTEKGPDSVKNYRFTLIETRDAPPCVQDKSLHPRQVNLPDDGDALFAIWTENEKPPCLKGIWLTNDEGRLQKLPPHHPQTDSLCYPLLFPNGEDGYHKNILYNTLIQTEKPVSNLTSPEQNNDINSDACDDEDDDYFSDNQSTLSCNSALGINKRTNVSVREYIRYRMAIREGEMTHNLWSAGGAHSQKITLDYAARIDCDYANFIRRPELNLRSTLPENILRWLARNAGAHSMEQLGSIVLFRKHDPGTRPYFQQKFYDATTIMARCKKPGYASFLLTFTANPKWPEIKRNFLHKAQRTIDRFDLICRIYEDKLKDLHFLLDKKRGKAIIIYDNSRVSSYNPFILVRYETHHNIEFLYGKTNNFKYVFKYPFKGPSFSYVKTKEQKGKINIDEPAFYAKMLYRSPPEAYSRIMSYRYAFLSHTVIPLTLHLPGQQKIYIKPGQENDVAQQIQAGELPETPLTAYWKQWKIDQELKKTLFENMPEHYSIDRMNKIWKKRRLSARPDKVKKRKPIIGRIYPVSPRNPELFALYLLTKHFPGDPNHLKSVNPPNVCLTFLEAARLRGLIDDNDVWVRTIAEGAASLMPGQMRQLFANILIFGSTENCLIDGAFLWEKFISHMYDTRCTDAERPARIERAIVLLERLLVAHGRQCKDFGLPTPAISIMDDPKRGLNEFFFPQYINDDEIDQTVDTSAYEKTTLNDEQQQFFSLIKTAFLNPDQQRLFYLCGDGGTGKTFLLNYILFNLRKIGAKVIPTASTGMASTRFYVGGTTVHSAFKFGINNEQGKLPSIPFDSFFGRRIIEADIIIIDEMTMLDRIIFENVEALCRLMCMKKKLLPFGGKCVIISGDWKQSLPVVIDYIGAPAQIAASLQSSPIYPMFQKYKLVQNMRVNPKEKDFLKWLDNIGRGIDGETASIPQNMLVDSREELIDWVFDKGFDISTNDMLKRLLLGTTNRIVDLNNTLILERFKASYFDYYSVDKALNENPMAVNAVEFDVSELNLLNPLGMPHHHLRLKVGSIIVLLLNLNTAKGLCNGTRLIVKKLTPNLIEAEAITGGSSKSGLILGIPRHRSTYKDKRPDGVSFERFQFPVRIAFTMTVVKAQGQTCNRLGIDFTEEPFSHGQLYTALSRVTSADGLKIYAPNKPLNVNKEPKIRNIVAKEIEFD